MYFGDSKMSNIVTKNNKDVMSDIQIVEDHTLCENASELVLGPYKIIESGSCIEKVFSNSSIYNSKSTIETKQMP
jgi:hypothetical protein